MEDADIMEIGRCVEFYVSKRQFIGEKGNFYHINIRVHVIRYHILDPIMNSLYITI